MKYLKKKIKNYLLKRGYKKFNQAELQMIIVSTEICEQYIKSRKFRRIMDEANLGKTIREVLNDWGKK